ncbi:hypothetical protein BDV93DRAFT_242119 [Ceratobasidium sp. AG-I]|nr:hypothetical protein BDV93DRAFT_242119 [Ceratobasidium sp. AG-I]
MKAPTQGRIIHVTTIDGKRVPRVQRRGCRFQATGPLGRRNAAGVQYFAVPNGWEEYHHPEEGRPYFYTRELRTTAAMYIRHTSVPN